MINTSLDNGYLLRGIGINSENKKGVLVYSKATFDQLSEDLDLYKVEYDGCDWGGCCSIETLLKNLDGVKITGREFPCKGCYEGYDTDWGRSYQFKFEFDKVIEIELVQQPYKNPEVTIMDDTPTNPFWTKEGCPGLSDNSIKIPDSLRARFENLEGTIFFCIGEKKYKLEDVMEALKELMKNREEGSKK